MRVACVLLRALLARNNKGAMHVLTAGKIKGNAGASKGLYVHAGFCERIGIERKRAQIAAKNSLSVFGKQARERNNKLGMVALHVPA